MVSFPTGPYVEQIFLPVGVYRVFGTGLSLREVTESQAEARNIPKKESGNGFGQQKPAKKDQLW